MKRLEQQLQRIDGKGYKAYKDIQGTYHGEDFKLHIDYVQGDPFASPSRIRVEMPQSEAKLKQEWFEQKHRQVATEDFLARQMSTVIGKQGQNRTGTGKSGMIDVDRPGQEILERTTVAVDGKKVELRLSIGLPARGRKILGRAAADMLVGQVPRITQETIHHFSVQRLEEHLQLVDQQQAIRHYLQEHGYVSFIANGSILPRESGVSNRPLRGEHVIPFQSPASFEVEIPVPHREPIRGMAIPRGITLIVGGGYHGKSTLLQAIERGVYAHIGGDGREYVLTDSAACKVRAEDGRRVEKVNISPFISDLPYGKNTETFSTDDASGSTSQAANIMEMVEMGATTLLIDEDTSATNFMIRDARMQKLVTKGKEPITPFVDKVRHLYEDLGISTVLVLGGSGDYLDVADQIIMMEEYHPLDVTQEAKAIASSIENHRQQEGGGNFGQVSARVLQRQSFDAQKGKKEKVEAKGLHTIMYGTSQVDLTQVEQIIDHSQTRAIANMMRWLAKKQVDGKRDLSTLIEALYEQIENNELGVVSPFYGQHPGDMALPRKFELAAAINRLRTLQVR